MSCQFTAIGQFLFSNSISVGSGRLWSASLWFREITDTAFPGGVISMGDFVATEANGIVEKVGTSMQLRAFTGSFPSAIFATGQIPNDTWVFVGLARSGDFLRGYAWVNHVFVGSTQLFSTVGTNPCLRMRYGSTFLGNSDMLGAVMAGKIWDQVELSQQQFEDEMYFLDPVHYTENIKGWYPIWRAAFSGRDHSGKSANLGGSPQVYAPQPPLAYHRSAAGVYTPIPPPAPPPSVPQNFDVIVGSVDHQVAIGGTDQEIEIGGTDDEITIATPNETVEVLP